MIWAGVGYVSKARLYPTPFISFLPAQLVAAGQLAQSLLLCQLLTQVQ